MPDLIDQRIASVLQDYKNGDMKLREAVVAIRDILSVLIDYGK